jgi:hypothetical protein
MSKILTRSANGSIEIKPNCQLVFGGYEIFINSLNNSFTLQISLQYVGDICDQGSGDVRVLNDLLDLKRRYSNSVHFILGNRDVNKLRILFEINEKKLNTKPNPYWLKGYESRFSSLDVPSSQSQRLKWLFQNTMGCPRTFDHRKKVIFNFYYIYINFTFKSFYIIRS